MRKQIFKKIFKWIIVLLIIFSLVIIIAGIYVTYFYKDKVVKLVINELNKQLQTEITVKDVDFTLIKHFPNASVVFYDVVIKGSSVDKKKITAYCDTLLKTEEISLDFDIFNLLQKKYVFKSIYVYDGNLNIFIDRKGNFNFNILKIDTSNEKSTSFIVKLNKIKFNSVKTYYENVSKAELLKGFVSEAELKGQLTDENLNLYLDGGIYVEKYLSQDVTYLKDKNLLLSIELKGDSSGYNINVGNLKLEDVDLKVKGNINLKDETLLDLQISSKDEKVKKLLSLLPSDLIKYMSDYDVDGVMNFIAFINGKLTYNVVPHIEGNFNIKNGTVTYNTSGVSLKDVNLSASFTNGKQNSSKTAIIEVDTFYARLNNSYLKASYVIKNILTPKFYGKSYVNLNVDELISFLGIDTIESVSGNVEGHIMFAGEKNVLEGWKDVKKLNTEGDLSLNNIKIKFENEKVAFAENINSKLQFNNNILEINSLEGKIKGQKIKLKGILNNFFDFLILESKELNGVFSLVTSKLNLDKLLAGLTSNTSSDNSINYNIKFDIKIDSVLYKKQLLRNFVAKGVIGKNRYLLPVFSVNYAGGSITGNIGMNKNTVFGNVTTDNFDIKKTFMLFSDFGQNFITHKNLKGFLTSSSDFSFVLDDDGNIDVNSFKLTSDILIKNGELIDFEPLEELSAFLSLKEVKHIYFTDIKNTIYIDKGKLVIPEMHIVSSSLDFYIDGYHYFSGEFEYHIKLFLSEILSKKYRRNNKDNEFVMGQESNGGSKIFLVVFGDTNNLKFKYDKQRVKAHIKERIKEEKNNLKNIIKQEFHWFTKDTTIKNKVKKENNLKKRLKEKRKKEKEEENKFQFDFEE